MKRKFSSMGRVAIALVLALSLSLVMAVPVMAAHDVTVTLTPATTKGDTSIVFSLTVENTGGADAIDTVTLDVPPPGIGGSNHIVTELLDGPGSWTADFSVDELGNINVITWTGDTIADGASAIFTFTATTPSLGVTYSWDWSTTDTIPATVSGTAVTTADNTSPTLNTIAWTDVDTSTDFSATDTLLFTFSEAIASDTITNTTLDVDLPLSSGSWGTGLTVTGLPGSAVTVTLGSDFTFVSGVTVNPADTVTDVAGNPDDTVPAGEPLVLPTIEDGIGPTLDSIGWTDADTSTDLNAGDTLLFTFSENMDTSTVTGSNLSTRLPLSAGSYGTATIDWATPVGDKTLTVTLGTGVDIASLTTVNPDSAVTDAAGNADGTLVAGPAITENVGPTLLSIIWDDVDSSVDVNIGDTLVFTFSEEMDTTTIDNTNISTVLATSGTKSYGAVTAGDLSWNDPDNNILAVTLATGTTIITTETVNPTDAVKDVAGNIDATTGNGPAIVQVTVSIDAPAIVVPGASFTATVEITNVADLDAASYNVLFDSAVLELTSVTAGTVGTTTIPVSATADILGGDPLVVVGVTVVQNVSGTEGVSGSGTLAVLNFTFIGNSGDSSTITFAVNMLGDNQANEIYANWFGASVAATALVGDANGDGQLNALDITKIELIVAGDPDHPQTPGADANEDSNIDALDITTVELLVGNFL